MNKQLILVTGASRGIGAAIALELARAGYDLYLTCHHQEEALKAIALKCQEVGAKTYEACLDMGQAKAVEALFQKISDLDHPLKAVVNNAGMAHYGLLQDLTPAKWETIIGTNLNSVFYSSRLAIPLMLRHHQGVILNLSSIWGQDGAACEVAYSASKGGVDSFTKALSKELAPSGIRVNAVSCGVIDTQMNGHLNQEERQDLEQQIGLGRFGQPSEVAKLVAYLVSDDAQYITGQIIRIDGGF